MFAFLFNFLSPYAHPFEKKVDRFLKKITSSSNPIKVHKGLEALMQENLVVLNLWIEKKYKNYLYLKKKMRRELYDNTTLLTQDFLRYADSTPNPNLALQEALSPFKIRLDTEQHRRLTYLFSIMNYLRPGGRYHYEAASNFGKLLKNPTKERLIGDCNQIVTLYAYFYSIKFPLSELKIKILPGHVCLHFEGIDIEATSGQIDQYATFEHILPITELISTNLLDVNDEQVKTGTIEPRSLLKCAQLAYLISSLRTLVDQNLKIAYHNVGVSLLKSGNWDSALFFIQQTGDPALLAQSYEHAALSALKDQRFSKAEYYAKASGDRTLQKKVAYGQGAYHYNQKQFLKAIPYFEKAGEEAMVKAAYQGQCGVILHKVRGVKTVTEAKRYRSDFQQLKKWARLSGNHEIEAYAEETLRKM
jgi:hypothetical protein